MKKKESDFSMVEVSLICIGSVPLSWVFWLVVSKMEAERKKKKEQ